VKIHIIGGPGSGKTTLAASLAARFGLPHHDLDQVVWQHGASLAGNLDEAFQLTARPGWVSEGVFLGWVEPLLAAADCIIHIEVAWPVAYARVLRRHILKTLRGANPYKTSQLWPFLSFVHDYYTAKIDANPVEYAAGQAYLERRAAWPALPSHERLLEQLPPSEDAFPLNAAFTRFYLASYRARLFTYHGARDEAALLRRLDARPPAD